MIEQIRQVYERYGFDPVETRRLNTPTRWENSCPTRTARTKVCSRFKMTTSSGSRRVTISPRRSRATWPKFPEPSAALSQLSLRLGFPQREARPGRYRQFMQFDADTVGAASMAADAEICMMAADTMGIAGILARKLLLKVNSRKILDGVLEFIGLGGDANAGKRLTVLRAIDKLDRLGIEEASVNYLEMVEKTKAEILTRVLD
jgi:histidyl-tRNA synthetase